MSRIKPISDQFGIDRGQPIDRYYIEQFLRKYQADIRGHVLEIAEPLYVHKFGGDGVTRVSILHAVAGNPHATLIGDLATGDGIPEKAFDCMILTQTLPFIFDMQGVIKNCFRALNPGGVILATFPGISQISRYDMDRWGDYWRFTPLSAERLFAASFPKENIAIESAGNVLAATGLLHGLAVEDLPRLDLDYNDADYPVIISVKAVRP